MYFPPFAPTGLHAFVVSSAVLVGMWIGDVFQACLIVDRIYPLMCACYSVSVVMAILVYLHSLRKHPANEFHTKTGECFPFQRQSVFLFQLEHLMCVLL